MNSTFDIKRFWMYLKRDFVLNTKQFVAPEVAMVFVLLIYLWFNFQHYPKSMLFGLIMIGGAIMVLIQSSMIANSFQTKTVCTDFLTTPASMLEKYLVKIVKHFALPLIFYVITLKVSFDLETDDDILIPIVIAVVFFSGIFLLWGAVLRKFAMLAAIIIIVAVLFTLRMIAPLFFNSSIDLMWLDPVRVFFQSGDISLSGSINTHLTLIFGVLASLFLLLNAVAGYFIYRDKELHVKLNNW